MVQGAVANWRGLLSGSVADGRQMLREVLEAPLRFTTEGKTYGFTGPVATGKLIAGAVLPTYVASPTLASWNQVNSWLRQVEALRRAAQVALGPIGRMRKDVSSRSRSEARSVEADLGK